MNDNSNSIEQKVQADYDQLAGAFRCSREDMQWPEVSAMINEIPAQSKVLDLGCGVGRVCKMFSEKKIDYIGVDISQEQIKQAKEVCPAGKFQQGSMLNLSFAENEFDYVLMVASFHHLFTKKERAQALKEVHRVLKPGGTIFMTVMNFWRQKYWKLFFQKKPGLARLDQNLKPQIKWNDLFWPWRWQTAQPVYRYYHAFRKSELKKLLQASNLVIEKLYYPKNKKNLLAIGKKIV